MPYRVLGLAFLIMIFPRIAISQATQNQNDSSAISNDLYHIGWVWPESMPKLQADYAVDEEGRVYAFDDSCDLYCIDSEGEIDNIFHGEIDYVYRLKYIGEGEFIFYGSTRMDSSNILNLYCIGLDGNIKWKFRDEKNLFHRFYTSLSGEIYIIVEEISNLIRRHLTGFYIIDREGNSSYYDWPDTSRLYSYQIDETGRLVLAFTEPAKLAILSPEGKILTTFTDSANAWLGIRNLYVSGDKIYCVTGNSRLIALDYNLDELWSYHIESDKFDMSRSLAVTSDKSTLFVANLTGKIYSFAVDNGDLNWERDLHSELSSLGYIQPLRNNNLLVVGAPATMTILNNDGHVIWHHTMYNPGHLYLIDLLPDGDILISQERKLYRFTKDPDRIISEPEPTSPPINMAAAREEIIHFLLDDFVQERITSFKEYFKRIGSTSQATELEAACKNLIIYCPAGLQDTIYKLDLDLKNPIKVWLLEGERLNEVEDMIETIDRCINDRSTDSLGVWKYNRYEFGIISISDDLVQAEVVVENRCGPMCGRLNRCIIRRSPSGEWWFVDTLAGLVY